ncbi:MAG: hypothetical protein R3B90_14425 [Planctomycetaceae bacterium]
MGGRAGGLGAFLLSLPVSAILLMAVFGIPKFAPGVGNESQWENARQFFTGMTEDEPADEESTHPSLQDGEPFGRPERWSDMQSARVDDAPRWQDDRSRDSQPALSRGAAGFADEADHGRSEWPSTVAPRTCRTTIDPARRLAALIVNTSNGIPQKSPPRPTPA